MVAAFAVTLNAQTGKPLCTLTSGELHDMVLEDSSYAVVFPQEVVTRHDSILVFGAGGLTDSRGYRLRRNTDDSAVVGFLLTNGRTKVTAIPAPRGLPTARYFRLRASQGGWEAVFFVPDHDTIPGSRTFDDGVLWYALLAGTRWTGLHRVGRVHDAVVMRPNSSGLFSHNGETQFAVFYGKPESRGGVLLWRRSRDGAWSVDTLPAMWGPLSVTATPDLESLPDAHLFPVMGFWQEAELFAGSLFAISASKPFEWKVLRRSLLESMNEPVEIAVKDTLHVSWWQFGRGEPPSVWYQALDPRRENPTESRMRVVRAVNEFIFLALREGAGTRLVWAYRSPNSVDSAEVAVVANGEPEVIGQVAFPFGFMTNGVASGDRSFTLATSPRPVPDGEPSASRTLEIRVNCSGGR